MRFSLRVSVVRVANDPILGKITTLLLCRQSPLNLHQFRLTRDSKYGLVGSWNLSERHLTVFCIDLIATGFVVIMSILPIYGASCITLVQFFVRSPFSVKFEANLEVTEICLAAQCTNHKLICLRFQVENESRENAGVMTNQLCLTSEWLALHGAHCGGSVLYYNRSTWLRLTPFNYCLQKPFHNVMQRGT